MDITIGNTTAYILAGGKSSRMGSDKGLLLIEGKAMIQYVIEQVQSVFSKVVIVSNNLEYGKFGLEVIPDLIKDVGPAGGIYSALNHSVSNSNFIVSCDMPFVTKEAIHYIFSRKLDAQIVLLKNKENLEPLFGLYAKNCEEIWLNLIHEKNTKLQEMVLHFNLQTIDAEHEKVFSESFFRNINTLADFKNISNLI
jgi:molybdopterin-guanine dinucleotide biosynthesis protein A